MKTITLLILATFTLISCKNDDDSCTPTNPIGQLPPATQTGANTAGALANGEAIYPKGTGIIFNLFYINGLNFGLGFSNEKNNIDRVINIASLNENLQVGQTYQLKESGNNSKYAEYSIGSAPPPRINFFQTTSSITGELTITHHNYDNATISGTFWFDAIDSEGNLVEVREGRFDAEY